MNNNNINSNYNNHNNRVQQNNYLNFDVHITPPRNPVNLIDRNKYPILHNKINSSLNLPFDTEMIQARKGLEWLRDY